MTNASLPVSIASMNAVLPERAGPVTWMSARSITAVLISTHYPHNPHSPFGRQPAVSAPTPDCCIDPAVRK